MHLKIGASPLKTIDELDTTGGITHVKCKARERDFIATTCVQAAALLTELKLRLEEEHTSKQCPTSFPLHSDFLANQRSR